MMPIERMRPEDFDAVFRLLARSFPAGERRDKAGQRALLADSAYQIDILRAPSGGVEHTFADCYRERGEMAELAKEDAE